MPKKSRNPASPIGLQGQDEREGIVRSDLRGVAREPNAKGESRFDLFAILGLDLHSGLFSLGDRAFPSQIHIDLFVSVI